MESTPAPRLVEWERELRARLVAGDELALGELYDQYSAMVFGLAVRLTDDRGAAEDITQEVFLFVWERSWTFDPDRGRLRAWLATMAHHRAVDHLRRVKVRERSTAAGGVRERDLPPPPNPEEIAVAAAVAKRVRVAVEELPAAQRTAILLAYFEGKTFRQVAELTGVPEGTAKSRLRLGLGHIADRLQAEDLAGEW